MKRLDSILAGLRPAPKSAARTRRPLRRPAVEVLEGRALLSVAGGPDLTFGSGGYAIGTKASFFTYSFLGSISAAASVLQPNGDLVEVGTNSGSNIGGPYPSGYSGFYALRYTADGQLDPTFQASTFLNVTTGGSPFAPPTSSGATGVALQSDGKIIVVGEMNEEAKVVRLDADGTIDTSFGTAGVVTLGTVNSGDAMLDYASTVSVLSGGQIAVGGSVQLANGVDSPAVEVLNANGSIDTSFGTNGLAVAPLPAGAQGFEAYTPISMVVQADGKIVIGANVNPNETGTSLEIVVTRLTTAGALDTSYGTAGQAIINPQSVLPNATALTVNSLALEPDGNLIVGGLFLLPGSNTRLFVARLGADGQLDPTFGVAGVNILPAATSYNAYVKAIAVQPDGKIVVADGGLADFARLNPNGFLDVTFGTAGQSVLDSTTPVLKSGSITSTVIPYGTVGLAITASGKILATENDSAGGVRQLLGQGAVNDFDGDGISDRAVYMTSLGNFAYTPSSGVIGPIIHFGPAGAGQTLPASGAYGGEGIDELGIYIPAFGEFAIVSLQTGQIVVAPFGLAGAGVSLPAPGDYDKSGATELAVYVPSSGVYGYRPANGGADVFVAIGTPGGDAIPVPADYFNTGQDDVAVYDQATASYLIQNPTNGQIATFPFGIPGAGNSIPVPGDYDGSGRVELAVYLPSLAEVIYQPAGGGSQVTIPFGIPGAGQTLPAPGDYDGSGKTEVAAYFPGSSVFAYRPANGGNDVYEQLGIPNQTIPFATNTVTFAASTVSAESVAGAVSAEIPLTQDLLDSLAGTVAKKKAGQA